jgi:hypothetical protein
MSKTQQSALFDHQVTDEEFYGVIERLKTQGALPRDTFVKEIPFFTFRNITKESQVKELFQDTCDPHTYKNLLKNIITNPEDASANEMISKRLSVMQVMSFAQVVLYKVLPCPDENCPNQPREIATHNQYKDYEYQCPFYHHDRDRRRLVITPNIGEEFVFKANYFEDGKGRAADRLKYSQNYFESMVHPLYYKMFRCKREYCNFSQLCPFYHSEEEKKTWDRTFSNYIRKDRISYVKDKQKYYEKQDSKKKFVDQEEKPAPNGKSDRRRKNYAPRRNNDQAFVNNFEQNITEKPSQAVAEKPSQNKFMDEWDRELDAQSPKSSTSQTSKDSKSSKDSGLSKESKNYRYLSVIKVN